jgi:hypothetical protein
MWRMVASSFTVTRLARLAAAGDFRRSETEPSVMDGKMDPLGWTLKNKNPADVSRRRKRCGRWWGPFLFLASPWVRVRSGRKPLALLPRLE